MCPSCVACVRGIVFGKSWECASCAVTTRRVEALKRGLQVVSVSRFVKALSSTAVSFGDTTWERIAL